MTNRREILQGGIALTSLPLVAGAYWSSPHASAHCWYAPYRVIFDDRFAETRVFGEEAERLGGSVRSFAGDITDLWYQELDLRWRSEPTAIAGMTRHGPLFCLERLAWNAGMRVVYRATHAVREGSTDSLPDRLAHDSECCFRAALGRSGLGASALRAWSCVVQLTQLLARRRWPCLQPVRSQRTTRIR